MKNLTDTWYGWVVVCSAAIIVGSEGGFFKSSGQIYMAILERTSFTRTQVATACVLPRTMSAVLGIIGSKSAELYSFRASLFIGVAVAAAGLSLSSFVTHNIVLFTLTFGVITGLGCGLSMSPGVVIAGLYFKKKRSLAIGVMTSLAAVTPLYMPLVLQFFLDEYNLEGALLLLAGFLLQGCVAAMFVRQPVWAFKKAKQPVPSVENQHFLNKTENPALDKIPPPRTPFGQFISIAGKELFKDLRYFRNLEFILLLCNRIVIFTGTLSVYLIFPPFAREEGVNISHSDVAFLLSVMGVGDILSKIFSGWLMNCFPKRKITIYLSSLVLLAVVTFAFQFARSYVEQFAFCFIHGVLVGYCVVGYTIAVFDTFPPAQVTGVSALQYTVSGAFTMTTGPIVALIRDSTGSYQHCWTLLGIAMLLSAVLSVIHAIFIKKPSSPEPALSA